MRRAGRLFDIIQYLRTARGPVTAASIAEHFEVGVRTVYRDIAALQARRIPIEGEPGLGYVLRRGFDLPPLMFTTEEVEAIAVGARMLRRTGDAGLQEAAVSVLSKLAVVVPDALRDSLAAPPVYVSPQGAPEPPVADLAAIRAAIRAECKLHIDYADEKGHRTQRTVWPIAVAYGIETTLVSAWCELRSDFRHFRADRISAMAVLDQRLPVSGRTLMARWLETLAPPQPQPDT
ncbi:MAG: YafY family transcriptional regulator [Alphaproteobacteria bacterium]|nr:YafY family transcriptional regulator [Alphaproteobacteria bacterium]MBV8576552.1 YafY family transcriptional regulator [Acetobacteraceae bacterium]